MRPLVTQNNLYMLLPAKVANIVTMLAKKTHTPELCLLKEFYRSNTYKALEREECRVQDGCRRQEADGRYFC